MSSSNEEELASRRRTAFLARAKKDIEEVLVDPAMQVFPHEREDGFDICLVLTPYGGNYAGFRLHFRVELRVTGKTPWPIFPPKILPGKGIEHKLLPQGRGFHFPMYDGYYLRMVDAKGHRRLWCEKYEPSHTLGFIFENLLHLISAYQIQSGSQQRGYRSYTFDPYLMTTYLSDADYKLLQIPVEEASISQYYGSHYWQMRLEWEADSGIEITLLSHQITPTSTLTVHKVKSHLPSGRTHQIEKHTSKWYAVSQELSKAKCDDCPYGSFLLPRVASELPPFPRKAAPVPPSLLLRPPSCKLGVLLDDNFAEIAKWLEPLSIRAFAAAYPRFDRILSQFQILQTRALRCSILRTPLCDSGMMGIKLVDGMRFWDDPDDSCPLLLSLAGFEVHEANIRLSSTYFEHDLDNLPSAPYHEYPALFLPLALNQTHFQRHRVQIMRRLDMIHEVLASRETPPEFSRRRCSFCPHVHLISGTISLGMFNQRSNLKHLRIIGHWMSLILDQVIADPWHDLTAEPLDPDGEPWATAETQVIETDKAVAWYCQLLHLALTICRDDPSALVEVKAFIRDFVKGVGDFPGCSHYREPYDVDHLTLTIVFLTIVSILEPATATEPAPSMEWSTVNGPLLRRLFHGTAGWYLMTTEFECLQVVESGVSDFRLVKTFQAMQCQLTRFMVGVSFLKGFAATYASNISLLDDNYGFIDAKLTERLLNDIRSCVQVKTWPSFFRQVGWSRGLVIGKDTFCTMLQQTMREVVKDWRPTRFHEIEAARRTEEAKWNEQRSGRLTTVLSQPSDIA